MWLGALDLVHGCPKLCLAHRSKLFAPLKKHVCVQASTCNESYTGSSFFVATHLEMSMRNEFRKYGNVYATSGIWFAELG